MTSKEGPSCPLCGKGATPAIDMATDQPSKAVLPQSAAWQRLHGIAASLLADDLAAAFS